MPICDDSSQSARVPPRCLPLSSSSARHSATTASTTSSSTSRDTKRKLRAPLLLWFSKSTDCLAMCSRVMLSCSVVLLKDLPQDTASPLPPQPAAAPTVRPNVSGVLPLLRCSKVYRALSHALVSCCRVKAAVANLHTDVDLCFLLRLITYQATQCFVRVVLFFAMHHETFSCRRVLYHFVSPSAYFLKTIIYILSCN